MSHRMQVALTDEQYARLRDESARSGLGLAELVRRAVDRSYASATKQQLLNALDVSFGSWANRDIDGADHLEGRSRCALGLDS